MHGVTQPFQSSAWPDLGIITRASAKASSSASVHTVDTIGIESGQSQDCPHVDPLADAPQSGPAWPAFVAKESNPPNKRWSPPVANADTTLQSPAPQLPTEATGRDNKTVSEQGTVKSSADAGMADTRPGVEPILSFGKLINETNVDSAAATPHSGKWLGLFCSAVIVVALSAWWMSGRDPSRTAESTPVAAKPAPPVATAESNGSAQPSSAELATPAAAVQVEVPAMQPKKTAGVAVNQKANDREKTSAPGTASAVRPTLSSPPASATGAVTQAPVAATQTVPSPHDVCSNLGVFARNSCLAKQCEKSVHTQHAQCQRWRTQQQEHEHQRLYGGS